MTYQRILTKQEINDFEAIPVFNEKERDYYFNVPNKLLKKVDKTKQIYFILLYGYFKATNKFFLYSKEDKNIQHLPDELKITKSIKIPTRSSYHRYKEMIRNYLMIERYSNDIKSVLINESINLASNFVNRKKIFYTLVELSKKLKIEIPSYTEFTRIITLALNSQKKDILDKLEPYLQDIRLEELNEFLEKNDHYKNKYHLVKYKKLEHSTNKKQMIQSLVKLKTIKSKFNILKEIIETIGLSSKTAHYHAQWIEKSRVFQVKRKKDVESNFLLLSFVYYQYLVRNDNLIDRFVSIVQSAKTPSFRTQKEFVFEQEPQKNKLIQSLEDINLSTLNDIEEIVKNKKLSAVKKVLAIEELVAIKSEYLKNILVDKNLHEHTIDNKYDFISKKSISLQGKLSDILQTIEFDEKNSNKDIIEAIKYFRNNSTITNKAPHAFLDEEERLIIFTDEKFKISLYKVLLFFHASDAIKNGTLNLKYSFRYRNFDDYLIEKDYWYKNKDTLFKVHDLEYLKDFHTFIEPIKIKLKNSFKNTNENINKGFNTYFTATDNSFILKTPKVDKDENQDSISKYFPNSEYISIIDVLNTINKKTDFLSSFQHYSQSKAKINHNLLLAAILGYGCNLSLLKIGKISKGINENQLDNTKIWYFSEDNTIEANNKIIKYMDTLELVKLMRADIDINHTSSDGQKYNMSSSIDSTNAGFSFKYFGTLKGVVAYTFIDESHRLFHSQVINVNARESGYVIDGLLNNDVVKSDIHSTDTHGFTEIIFGLTNILGFSFAPRIKNLKTQQLYDFISPKEYNNLGYKLSSKRKINEKIIEENWDDILRFVLTIKEKKSTATQLLKRLTSYSKHHKLYTAIKEFGKAIKTDFLLNYIDDVVFRQRIEKQLNKVESSNKFSKAVFFGNNSEFTVATAAEQNIANNSKRLIQNAIILWNYLYITKKYKQAKNQTEKDEIIKAFKNSSIIHWSHINFYGEYDFTRSSKRIQRLITLDDNEKIV